MGRFTIPIQVSNLDGTHFLEMDALVDTSRPIYSMAPRDVLDKVGVLSHETCQFTLPDDSLVDCDLGYARFRFEQREVIALVIFAPDGSTPLLGKSALENAQLGVDPANECLVPKMGLLKQAV